MVMNDDIASDAQRKARIEERWKRIQAKLVVEDDENAKHLLPMEEKPLEEELAENVKRKIKKYNDSINTKLFHASQRITDFTKNTDFKESKRKKEYLKQINHLDDKITNEREAVKELTLDLDEKWQDIALLRIPQEMYKAMLQQKQEYQQLLKRKVNLMKELGDYFHIRKEGYTALFKSQESTINNLITKSHSEIKHFGSETTNKLIQIECAFVEERRGILEHKQKEIDGIFENRRKQELTMLDKENENQVGYYLGLKELRQNDYEKFQSIKTQLEKKIMVLVQDLEDVRAKYQLNYEKLMYNYVILKEREKDNLTTVSNQKKRFKRLREALVNTKHKYETLDIEFQKENNQLSEEYKRITRQYKELRKKI